MYHYQQYHTDTLQPRPKAWLSFPTGTGWNEEEMSRKWVKRLVWPHMTTVQLLGHYFTLPFERWRKIHPPQQVQLIHPSGQQRAKVSYLHCCELGLCSLVSAGQLPFSQAQLGPELDPLERYKWYLKRHVKFCFCSDISPNHERAPA